eukprot:scaffold41174_cov66-Phaeocystis_antarctica.AAC.2
MGAPADVAADETRGAAAEAEAAEAAAGGTGASANAALVEVAPPEAGLPSRYAATSASVSAAAAGDSVFCAARPSHMQSLLWDKILAADATCFWNVPCAAMCSSSRCMSCARSEEIGAPADAAAEEVGVGPSAPGRAAHMA